MARIFPLAESDLAAESPFAEGESASESKASGYPHAEIEARWGPIWEAAKIFEADARSTKPAFSMAMPPPNITGSLHMGHALSYAIEDAMARFQRMSGSNTLWLPGTDHAGIAAQLVVERQLKKEGGDRQQLGREAFLERVWLWKAQSGGRITEQLRTLGCSVDWSRERFTLDPGLSRAVRRVFVQLFREGLIYRAERLINWCPGCLTALSDLEVDRQERQSKLWQLAYKVEGTDRLLPVATTRPETLLGDSGVAVHPDDPRYRDLIGRKAIVPLLGRLVPIVGDATLVDREFGSGVVKVTPAHDFNDFEAGRRHGLPSFSIFDERAKVVEGYPPYSGLDRSDARRRILADLQAQELLLGSEDHRLSVGTCQRSGDVVEPRMSRQWFVKIAPLAEPAIAAVERGDIRFVPDSWSATYFHWMHNIKDWCISRQLWWGHQIPAWHCSNGGHLTVVEEAPPACTTCGASVTQDPDVLDTWFSSALWPFSTLGWPDKTPDLATFYPTTVLETGSDILFFWVARMIMLGLKFTGQAPFRDVYLHAIVRDAQGDKMSKTKGNVIDPLEVTAEYGADALRFSLLAQSGQGRDIKLSLDRVSANRAFANKIWNASRFAMMHLGDLTPELRAEPLPSGPEGPGLPDRWIRSRLAATAEELQRALAEYRFPDAALAVYHFLWNDLCDWYIELCKLPLLAEPVETQARRSAQRGLADALDGGLRLLHLFMPFLSEEIWQKLPRLPGDPKFLAVATLPLATPGLHAIRDLDAEAEVGELLQTAVGAIRSVRGEVNVPPGKRIVGILRSADPHRRDFFNRHRAAIALLAQLSELRIELTPATGTERLARTAAKIFGDFEVLVPLDGLVDFEAELLRLSKEIQKAEKDLQLIAGKLDNQSFVARAPAEVVAKDRERRVELLAKIDQLRGYRAMFASQA